MADEIEQEKAAATALNQNENYDLKTLPFLAISPKKLAILVFFSFGLYGIYWFYTNWVRQKNYTGTAISQFWRTVFSAIYISNLLTRVKRELLKREIASRYSPALWTTVYFAVVMLSVGMNIVPVQQDGSELVYGFPMQLVIMTMYCSVFYFTQKAMQSVNSKITSKLDEKYNLGDWAYIVIGGLMWLLMLFVEIMVVFGL